MVSDTFEGFSELNNEDTVVEIVIFGNGVIIGGTISQWRPRKPEGLQMKRMRKLNLIVLGFCVY